MKGRACQKVFLGSGFPRFKRIIKLIDVAKTGGLGHFDARHGLHQFSTSAQRRNYSFMDTPRVKCLSIECERVIGCGHLSGLISAAI